MHAHASMGGGWLRARGGCGQGTRALVGCGAGRARWELVGCARGGAGCVGARGLVRRACSRGQCH